MDRRSLIKAGLVGTAAAATVPLRASASDRCNEDIPKMNMLVLGGTGFIGPHMVREALRRGHSVTLFNRGRSNASLFPDLKTLVGDRDPDKGAGLSALENGKWDAVIDNSGYIPRHVKASAKLLGHSVKQYIYISTISVYETFSTANYENSPLAKIQDESVEEVTGETYGPLKALCEKRAAQAIKSSKLTILRPTYICGPGDHTDRFSYWPVRTLRGGKMLWPGRREDMTQIIDVRDLANFTIDCVERRISGTYNTVTPEGGYSMGDLHDDCLAVSAADMQAVWVSKQFIERHDAGRYFPVWAPMDSDYAGLPFVNGAKAREAGLNNRPICETVRDTIDWWRTLPEDRELRAGLSPEREAELLALVT